MFNMFQFATNNVFESKFKAGGGRRQRRLCSLRVLQVHSMAIKGSVELDDGGKILLPPSALDFLSRLQISWPVFFHVRNPAGGRSTHCGVQEFTAEEGTCNMPYWMMQQLGFKEGSIAIIRQTNMARGTFAKIQPHSKVSWLGGRRGRRRLTLLFCSQRTFWTFRTHAPCWRSTCGTTLA